MMAAQSSQDYVLHELHYVRPLTATTTAPPLAGTAALQALASGGGKSEAYSSAIASAVSRGGCGAVSNVLAQAQAIAESSGRGDTFADSLASASAEAARCPRLPNCADDRTARYCCTDVRWVNALLMLIVQSFLENVALVCIDAASGCVV
jgi:hypothetical protein